MVVGVFGCDYIFCLIFDWIWIKKNCVFVLIDILGNIIYIFLDLLYIDLYNGIFVGYVIENINELIYIDIEFNINRLFEDLIIKNMVLLK